MIAQSLGRLHRVGADHWQAEPEFRRCEEVRHCHDLQPVILSVEKWVAVSARCGDQERVGYPTQKPEALLERIIRASSSEGDVVLDAGRAEVLVTYNIRDFRDATPRFGLRLLRPADLLKELFL